MTQSDPDSSTQIDTGGGSAFTGDTNTGGGDLAGRDKRINSGETSGAITAQVVHIYNAPINPVEPAAPVALPLAPLPAVPCPYRGLEPFEAIHAHNYFGRQAMVEKLVAKVAATNFVAVVGPSGSGKSSLVRAGLLTALGENKLPGSRDWHLDLLRPGDDPLRALAAALVNYLDPERSAVDKLKETRKLATSLQDGSLPIADVLAQVRQAQPALTRLLLVFDQFEETFTLCSDANLRRAFLHTLLQAANSNSNWLTILFTLRADFFGRVLEERDLGQRVDQGLVNVLPMTLDERRQAIEQPARNAGRHFEEGLVQRILDAVRDEPGELPLLEFALTELWEHPLSQTGLLTHAAYAAIGEVGGAIARRAEQTVQGLPVAEQTAVRKVFTRLVRVAPPDGGAEDTKRRLVLAELSSADQTLVRKLTDARLLVTDQDAISGSETVEVAHEALIRNWQQLQGWLNGDREFLLWRQRLRTLLANYQSSRQDEGALLRGLLLGEANAYAQTRASDLSEPEQGFITASQALAQREAEEKEQRIQHDLDQQRKLLEQQQMVTIAEQRRSAAVRQWLVIATLLLIAAGIAGFFAYYNYTLAEGRLALATERLAQLRGDELWREAKNLKDKGNFTEAMARFDEIVQQPTSPLGFNLQAEKGDVLRMQAIQLVGEGEALARKGDLKGAVAKYQAALDLNPPADTPVYVRVPAGAFTMGEGTEAHKIDLPEFWILRTEVTNGQYQECVAAKQKGDANGCDAPKGLSGNKLATWPVVKVSWYQANQYAKWKGGRLPTEAQWEKACRGEDAGAYPWGNDAPTPSLANYGNNEGIWTVVGSYPKGVYGLYDMVGNVLEWTSSKYADYPYKAEDGRETEISDSDEVLFRGGAFKFNADVVRCAHRAGNLPFVTFDDSGFRIVSPGF